MEKEQLHICSNYCKAKVLNICRFSSNRFNQIECGKDGGIVSGGDDDGSDASSVVDRRGQGSDIVIIDKYICYYKNK
jgi:hypothetical protein